MESTYVSKGDLPWLQSIKTARKSITGMTPLPAKGINCKEKQNHQRVIDLMASIHLIERKI
jgi:hypothetical protein